MPLVIVVHLRLQRRLQHLGLRNDFDPRVQDLRRGGFRLADAAFTRLRAAGGGQQRAPPAAPPRSALPPRPCPGRRRRRGRPLGMLQQPRSLPPSERAGAQAENSPGAILEAADGIEDGRARERAESPTGAMVAVKECRTSAVTKSSTTMAPAMSVCAERVSERDRRGRRSKLFSLRATCTGRRSFFSSVQFFFRVTLQTQEGRGKIKFIRSTPRRPSAVLDPPLLERWTRLPPHPRRLPSSQLKRQKTLFKCEKIMDDCYQMHVVRISAAEY